MSHRVPFVGSRKTPGSIALLSSTPSDHTTGPRVLPLVIRRLGIECLADQEADRRLRLRAWRGVVEKVVVADADQVRRPRVVAAARDDVRARFAAGYRLHDAAGPSPRPAVVGDRHGQAGARGVDVVLAVFDDHGRGIVQTGLAVQRHERNGENTGRGNSNRREARHEGHGGHYSHRQTVREGACGLRPAGSRMVLLNLEF